MTLGQLHQHYRPRFQLPGFAEAFSELLSIHFQLPAQAVWTRPSLDLSPISCRDMMADLDRFLLDTPLAHLTGRVHFFGLEFVLTPQVLIPRPDSECLLRQALACCPKPVHALDIGCGSGILAVCLALERPQVRVAAVDSSYSALRLARLNACRHRVSERIDFHHADLFPPADYGPAAGFDLILSNPPYISSAEMAELDPSVRDHEPISALHGGEDGLDFYRRIIPSAVSRLRQGGVLLFELGYRQADAVTELLQQNGYTGIRRHQDFAGIDRVIEGTRAQ